MLTDTEIRLRECRNAIFPGRNMFSLSRASKQFHILSDFRNFSYVLLELDCGHETIKSSP